MAHKRTDLLTGAFLLLGGRESLSPSCEILWVAMISLNQCSSALYTASMSNILWAAYSQYYVDFGQCSFTGSQVIEASDVAQEGI